jgi:glycosyltransferase involved in cell wall biosynthesis
MVLDEHNVYWNLLTYQLADAPFFRGWFGRVPLPRRWFLDRLLDRARRFEVRAIRDSARILVTSDIDRQAIVAECPDASPRVHVLPNCVDVERFPALPEHPDSRDVVFVGDFNYVPNREAAEFVSRTLAPGIPQARFLLVGSNPPEARDRPSNVVATGRVPDLGPILRDAAVCIAPLAHGSGTRIKILTYLASARPVVATTKACEGLPVLDGVHLLIRDDPREFRDAVRGLLDDAGARRSLASRGRELIASKLDWKVHVPWLREFAAEVCSGAGATASSRDFRTRSEPSPTR